jgi:hypothetical protein
MTTLLMSKIRAALAVASLALASLAVPFGSAALYAQHQVKRIRVDVPFAFDFGSAHFAPGTYFLSNPQEHILSVRGSSGTALAMDWREATPSPVAEGKVVFYAYGDRYFLREVWVKGDTDHLRFLESKAERRIKKSQQEANHAAIVTPRNVEIALLQNPR